MRLSNLIARAENATVAAYRTSKPIAQRATNSARRTTSSLLRKAATKLEPGKCQCVDCGGTQSRHSPDCAYMNSLHG